MKKIFILMLVLSISILSSCGTKKEVNKLGDEKNMSSEMNSNKEAPPISDFINIGSLPIATEKQSLKNVAKIWFLEIDDMQVKNMFAIDLANKGMYLNPVRGTEGYDAYDYSMSEEDVEEVLKILENSSVDSWSDSEKTGIEGDYLYSWYLYLQYMDGSIIKYGGSGKSSEKEKVQPQGYQNFVLKLRNFVDSK